MVSRLLGSAVLLAASLYSVPSMACSCLWISNPQQAAQGKNMVVAKVSTNSVDEMTGIGKLTVEKVYKGNVALGALEIAGQDGMNCAGSVLDPSVKSWVAIFMTTDDGNYMASCAASSLSFDKNGDIQVPFSGQVTVTEQQLIDLVNAKIVPSVKELVCHTSVSRNLINAEDSTAGLIDINYYDSISAAASESSYDVYVEKDFSADGGVVTPYVARAWASRNYGTNASYYVSMSATEPFFGVESSNDVTLNILERSSTSYLSLSTYKGLNGETKQDFNSEPFYGLSASLNCELTLGAPLVPVEVTEQE